MKQIFFFSNHCKFCQEAYNLINKIGKDNFVFVCIDTEKNIPPFIDRVPVLMLPPKTQNTKPEILYEKELFQYLYEKSNVSPFMKHEIGNSISDSYSYINNDGELDHSFSYLDKNSDIMITNEEKTSDKSIDYDRLLQERSKDLDDILKTQNRGEVDFTRKIV